MERVNGNDTDSKLLKKILASSFRNVAFKPKEKKREKESWTEFYMTNKT